MIEITIEEVVAAGRDLAGHLPRFCKIYGVPRGGLVPVSLLLSMIPGSQIVYNPIHADIIIDDLIDSGRTRMNFPDKSFAAFFHKCACQSNTFSASPITYFGTALPDEWVVFPWEQDQSRSIEDACTRLLQYVGEDPNREGLLETPHRMAKAWKEWTAGYEQDYKQVFKTFADGGENYDQMLVLDPIPFHSHCEHHMAAIFGEVYIGYIPNGRIAGLSKFARLVDVFARRLQVQERLTVQIADAIEECLEPLGVAVYIKARHFCMESRGVQKSGIFTKTAALRGEFKTDSATRAEFYQLLGK